MAGYYTSKRTNKSFRKTASLRSASLPGGGNDYRYQELDNHTVTSFRTSGDYKDLNRSYGKRDLFEPFYAYGSAKFDNGHPFQVDHLTRVLTHESYWARGFHGSNPVTYLGPLVPNYGGYGTSPVPITPINASYWGSKFVNDTLPTNPVANAAQTLAELKREGISFPGATWARWAKSRTSFLRSVGGEYLNVAFGYVPLIQGIVDICQTVLRTRSILEQLEKDSGMNVRRKRVRPVDVVSNTYTVFNNVSWRPPNAGNTSIVSNIFSGYPGTNAGQVGQLERIDRLTEQYSFSGAYTYYFENGVSPFEKLQAFEQKANLLLGVRVLTPEVLWELSPWSWLADYFANFGDLFSNLTRFSSDGLVMKYGYLMRHTVSERIYTQNGIAFKSGSPGPFAVTLKLERKERVRATPFGFGLNPNDFTVRQWTILAALGLSKSPRSLP